MRQLGTSTSTKGSTSRATINYNAKGQRILCAHGERTVGATSDPAYTVCYEYDAQTFRLTHLLSLQASSGRKLQDLSYVYDPVGNIVRIGDDGNWNVILQTQPVDGHGLYEYDPLYRLTRAEGREHPGQQGTYGNPDALGGHIPHANDTSALARYFEEYVYDEVGNIQSVHHGLVDSNPLFPDWTRTYTYATNSNRLLSTAEPIGVTPATAAYGYDDTAGAGGAHGSMTSMGHLSLIEWDYADRMQHVVRGTGSGNVYFNYDSSGQRVRKAYEHGSYIEQRIYLGGYEIYRRTNSGTLDVHRQTLHVMDDQKRVAMVETTLADTDAAMLGTRWRFQLDNHLGSTALETDAQGRVISYEEYHPYGTTAFSLSESDAHVSARRYRYTGKERDEETSLYYHGARYYAPWLGRWTCADPSGHSDDSGYFNYVANAPINAYDPDGNEGFLSNAWEVTKGVGSGIANTASGIKQMVTHPIATAKAIGAQMQEEYRKDGGGIGGVIMAANVVNPAYHAMVAGYETYKAVERGDYHAAGEQGFNTVLQTVSTVLVATGGAGAISRGFTRAPVGATPKPVPAVVPKPVPAAMPKPVPAAIPKPTPPAIPKPTPAAVPKALPAGPTPKGLLPPKGGTGAGRAVAENPLKQFDELGQFRRELGLPEAGSAADKSTLAKLEIGGQEFYGINRSTAGAPLEDLKTFGDLAKEVNSPLKGAHPEVLKHAEADALLQAFNKGITAKRGHIFVDRKLCGFCDASLKNLLPTLGLQELRVTAPNAAGYLHSFVLRAPK